MEAKDKLAQDEAIYQAGQQNGLSLKMQGEAYCQGILVGIRLVVEWGEEHCPHTISSYVRFKRECFDCRQAQLKEWGVK